MSATVTKLQTTKVTPTKSPRATQAAARLVKRQMLTGAIISAIALGVTAVSLTHLSHGIQIITKAPSWETWLMAVGIDLGFVALEMANMAVGEKLRKQISRWTDPAIKGTLLGSAVLNAFAFAAPVIDNYWLVGPAVALGVAVPSLIYALTRVGTTCWIGASHT